MMPLFSSIYSILLLFFFNQAPEYEAYSSELIYQYRREVLIPNGMKISSIGGSSDKGIKMIHLGVDAYGMTNITESRRKLVGLVEKLLKLYNEDEKIRPFLLDYPFTENNLEFEISFLNPDNNFWVLKNNVDPKDQVTYVTLYRGKIRYEIYTGEKIAPLKTVFSESYQEALKKVRSEKNH